MMNFIMTNNNQNTLNKPVEWMLRNSACTKVLSTVQIRGTPPIEVSAKDPDGRFMESNMPGSRLEILKFNQANEGIRPEDQAAASSGSFKLLG